MNNLKSPCVWAPVCCCVCGCIVGSCGYSCASTQCHSNKYAFLLQVPVPTEIRIQRKGIKMLAEMAGRFLSSCKKEFRYKTENSSTQSSKVYGDRITQTGESKVTWLNGENTPGRPGGRLRRGLRMECSGYILPGACKGKGSSSPCHFSFPSSSFWTKGLPSVN